MVTGTTNQGLSSARQRKHLGMLERHATMPPGKVCKRSMVNITNHHLANKAGSSKNKRGTGHVSAPLFIAVASSKGKKPSGLLVFLSFLMLAQSYPAFAQDTLLETAEISKDVGSTESTASDSTDDDLTVQDVTIEGNRLIPSEHILDVVKTKPGDRFDRDQIVRDLKAVNGMGYFDDRSLQALPERAGNGVLLKIRVQENAPVTQFAFQGNNVLSTEELSKLFAEQIGKPQNLTQLSQAIDKVEQLYHEKGYTLARVTDVKDDPDGSVSLSVDEGTIGNIKIVGNKKTKDFIIRNAIKLKPGSVYNEKLLTADLRKLFANGYFSDVRRSLSPSAANPDKYELKVEVDEKRTGSVGLGGGVDTIAGPFGSFSFADSNFRGRGQILSFTSQVGAGGMFNSLSNNINNGGTSFLPNTRNFQFEASFVEPNLKGTDTSMAISGFARNMGSMMVDEAQQRSYGAGVTFSKPLKKGWTASLGLLGETTGLKDYAGNATFNQGLVERAMQMGQFATEQQAAQYAQSVRDTQLKGGTYLSVSPSVYYDTRDDYVNPSKGTFAKFTATPAAAVTGGSFFKAGANVSKYVPINKSLTLAMNIQGGSSVGGLPQFSMYRLGGWNGIRGYRQFSDLGMGSSLLMSSVELRSRLPLPKPSASSKAGGILGYIDKNVRMVGFFDAGATGGNSLVNSFYQRGTIGASVGLGMRMNLPYVGLIRVDYGLPLVSTALGKLTPRMTIGFGDKF